MNRTKIALSAIVAVLVFTVVCTTIALAQDSTKFQVNMNVQVLKGKFVIASDSVWVVGGFSGFKKADSLVMVRNSLSDTIYTVWLDLPPGAIQYKFLKNLRGGTDWEADQPTASKNREYTVVAGAQTLPVVWFSNDSVYTPPPPKATIRFRVDMTIQGREGFFRPDLGDIVRISGDVNGWSNMNSTDTCKSTGPTDSVYTHTMTADSGSTIHWKFIKTTRGGMDWEGNFPTGSGNREYQVLASGDLPKVYFNNDSVQKATVTTVVLWQVDMSAYQTLGWFNTASDTMQVRGGFEGWSGTKMHQNALNPLVWETQKGDVYPLPTSFDYKFFMQIDSATAVARFGSGGATDWNDRRDGWRYEHPAERGDGNNSWALQNAPTQSATLMNFSGINPKGLLGANDSVNVTVTVNMGPAKTYVDAFVPGVDTVYLVFNDQLWYSVQQKLQGRTNFPSAIKMISQTGGGDSLYTVTFKVKGPTHYNMMYAYRYIHPNNNQVNQGGGLGVQNPYITRFIQKSAGVWPASYTAPTDVWQKNAPLPGESAQFPTGIAEGPATKPLIYKLNQNYPNPFNPSTTISFSLPKESQVTLKIFNILGQEVATLINDVRKAGEHVVVYDANRLATGVYFYRLEAGSFTSVKKMLLLK